MFSQSSFLGLALGLLLKGASAAPYPAGSELFKRWDMTLCTPENSGVPIPDADNFQLPLENWRQTMCWDLCIGDRIACTTQTQVCWNFQGSNLIFDYKAVSAYKYTGADIWLGLSAPADGSTPTSQYTSSNGYCNVATDGSTVHCSIPYNKITSASNVLSGMCPNGDREGLIFYLYTNAQLKDSNGNDATASGKRSCSDYPTCASYRPETYWELAYRCTNCPVVSASASPSSTPASSSSTTANGVPASSAASSSAAPPASSAPESSSAPASSSPASSAPASSAAPVPASSTPASETPVSSAPPAYSTAASSATPQSSTPDSSAPASSTPASSAAPVPASSAPASSAPPAYSVPASSAPASSAAPVASSSAPVSPAPASSAPPAYSIPASSSTPASSAAPVPSSSAPASSMSSSTTPTSSKTTSSTPSSTPVKQYCSFGTAFGYSSKPQSLTLNSANPMPNTCNRWGWYTTPTTAQLSSGIGGPLYVGAGQNDISKATNVGTWSAKLSGTSVSVTYSLSGAYSLAEVHVDIGCLPYDTCAPGQYTYVNEGLASATTSFTTPGLKLPSCAAGKLYLIVHASVNAASTGSTCPAS